MAPPWLIFGKVDAANYVHRIVIVQADDKTYLIAMAAPLATASLVQA